MIPVPAIPTLTLIRWGASLAFLALVCGGLVKCGYDKGAADLAQERADHRVTKGYHAEVMKDLAEKTKAAAEKAKVASEQAKTDRRVADARYEEAKADAKQARKDLADGLRNGSVRLQPWWGCPSGPADGGTATSSGRADDAADLRAAGAADLIAAADNADADIVWFQAELIATRRACSQ